MIGLWLTKNLVDVQYCSGFSYQHIRYWKSWETHLKLVTFIGGYSIETKQKVSIIVKFRWILLTCNYAFYEYTFVGIRVPHVEWALNIRAYSRNIIPNVFNCIFVDNLWRIIIETKLIKPKLVMKYIFVLTW